MHAPKPIIRQHAKVRVTNEVNGREWIGYAMRDFYGFERSLPLYVIVGETTMRSAPKGAPRKRTYLRLGVEHRLELV